jgi:hypothetical protein
MKPPLDNPFLDKELICRSPEGYTVYDRFMAIWLKRLSY